MRTACIFAALVLTLAAALPGQSRGSDLDESYYPLKTGMRWEYQVRSDKSGTTKLTITNLAPREVNGHKVTPRKWEMGGGAILELMEKDETGIYRYAEQAAENKPPTLVTPKECHLRFPVARGTSWTMTTKIDGNPVKLTLTMESVSDKVTVPAGAYKDCLMVREVSEDGGGLSVSGYEWYAPRVGVVKSLVVFKKKGKDGKETTENRTYQLQSFQP